MIVVITKIKNNINKFRTTIKSDIQGCKDQRQVTDHVHVLCKIVRN